MTLQAWVSCYVWLKVHQKVLELTISNLLIFYILITDLLIIKYLATPKFHTSAENFNTTVAPMKKTETEHT